MKRQFIIRNFAFLGLLTSLVLLLTYCTKDKDGSPLSEPGIPTFGSITPTEGSGGTVVTLKGSGLGAMQSIVFEKNNVPATFQPNLNTESSLIFRVPDTAFGGLQDVIFTNIEGKTLRVPFTVVALPTISTIYPIDFQQGTTVTITGNNLNDVTSVFIDSTNDQATIVSKERKKLVITMPSTTKNRAKLKITNASGVRVTEQELTYIPNAFAIFVEGWGPGMHDWSWAGTHDISSTEAYHGTKSFRVIYSAGGYQGASLHRDDPRINMSDYTFLTFWVKGGTADMNMEVYSENGGSKKTITVPANVWTYFRMPIQGHMNGVMLERLNFQAIGPNGGAQTIHFDNILLVK